ncbi:hypothetical protein FLAVO9R_80053 [Flavobacterium sp. 9R]|nr:hypothetical protein FLAVO9R_80053 [Flavobacterium sp. 9R]
MFLYNLVLGYENKTYSLSPDYYDIYKLKIHLFFSLKKRHNKPSNKNYTKVCCAFHKLFLFVNIINLSR